MQITASPFVHPVAHPGVTSSEVLARVGLPTVLAPMRGVEIGFVHPVGATEAAKENATINIQHR